MKKTTIKKDRAANAFSDATDILGGSGGGIDALFEQGNELPEFIANLDDIEIVEQVRGEEGMEDEEQDLQSLGDSLEKYQIQAILLRIMTPDHPKPYRLVAGERRVRAARLKGMMGLRAKAREMSDAEAEELQFAENIHRKNLTQIEESKKLQRDLDALGGDVEALLAKINKSNAWLSKRLSLLKLSAQAKRLITERISADLEVINNVKVIEKSDPAAAEELVNELKVTRGKTDARAQVAAVKEKVKPKTDKAKGDGAKSNKAGSKADTKKEKSDIFADAKNDEAGDEQLDPKALLNDVYKDIYEGGIAPSIALKAIGKDGKDAVEQWLQSFYDAGLKARDVSRAVIQGFRSGSFASEGEGSFALAAFLYGADSEGKFNMLNILGSVKA